MGLGHGEYLTISSCMLTPFKVERVKQLIERLRDFDTEFTKATFLNIPPDLVSYEVLWEGVDETELSSWSIRSLDRYFLSRLDMRIQQKVPAVMRVNFLDNTSYEVARRHGGNYIGR
jgi:hypothetical protein